MPQVMPEYAAGGNPGMYLKGNHMHGIPSSVLDWRALALAFGSLNTEQLRASCCAEVRELV